MVLNGLVRPGARSTPLRRARLARGVSGPATCSAGPSRFCGSPLSCLGCGRNRLCIQYRTANRETEGLRRADSIVKY